MVPVPVTLVVSATLMVSKIVLSAFLIVILPLWAVTFSLKFKTIFASSATLVALLAGTDVLKIGVSFATVKVKAVVELIPSYELPLVSSNAVASIST